MQGNVYRIAQDKHGGRPHFHVVILEFPGNKDCLVVPAFSEDGYKVNEVIQGRVEEGWRLDQIVVTLDNGKCIEFTSGHSGWTAHWLVSDPDRFALDELATFELVGQMNLDGMQRIAGGMHAFGEADTAGRFSSAVMKKLRHLRDS